MTVNHTYRTRLNFLQRITNADYWQLFVAWIIINLVFAGLYFSISLQYPRHAPNFPTDLSLVERAFDSVYFSIITATTVGFGDIVPLGFSKLLVMMQATGAFLIFAVLIGKLVSQRQDLALHEVHRMTFEGIFYQIRGGLFTVRKDFDTLIHKADQGQAFTHNDWNLLSTAYLQAENLIEQIPELYNGLGNQLHSVDLKRERLLFEAINRTLDRLDTALERFDSAKIDWMDHEESSRALHSFVRTMDSIMPLWSARSPYHEVKEFEDIRILTEKTHEEMKKKILKS